MTDLSLVICLRCKEKRSLCQIEAQAKKMLKNLAVTNK